MEYEGWPWCRLPLGVLVTQRWQPLAVLVIRQGGSGESGAAALTFSRSAARPSCSSPRSTSYLIPPRGFLPRSGLGPVSTVNQKKKKKKSFLLS